ncbi:MAG: P1 family peptidase [Nitrospinae bacterium]|nr:P1 family peptidase [Nitrospinota bacterium]
MTPRPGPGAASRITGVPGVHVGHWGSAQFHTGCTVVIFDKQSTASCHVAGGAPGSQETDLLDPSCLVGGVDAILLTGGSAFGLAAADGVRRYLLERGRGFDAVGYKVPIVPAAVIFDLAVSGGVKKPGPEEGYLACVDSERFSDQEGRVGVGAGASVGKYMGQDKRSPGGLASCSVPLPGGAMIGALMVANCYGAVINPADGQPVSGPIGADGKHIPYLECEPAPVTFGSTAIGVVATDCKLSKADAKRVAIMAHDGLARAVSPSHTPYDGDLIFVVSTGDKEGDITRLGAWAARLVEECIVAAALG